KKLQGRFALIRMRGKGRSQEQWLLIKMPDAFARPQERVSVNVREHGSPNAGMPHSRTSARSHARTPAHARRISEPPEDSVTYTHTEKLIYPEAGITKGDVLDFYRRIAPRLLPHLRDRPAT